MLKSHFVLMYESHHVESHSVVHVCRPTCGAGDSVWLRSASKTSWSNSMIRCAVTAEYHSVYDIHISHPDIVHQRDLFRIARPYSAGVAHLNCVGTWVTRRSPIQTTKGRRLSVISL